MIARSLRSAALVAVALIVSPLPARAAEDDGVIKFKSAYDMAGTIKRLKKDVADKGIMFFDEIDQSKLAADAGVTLLSSTLLCLAIRHSARCSLPQIQMPASTGRSGCSSIRSVGRLHRFRLDHAPPRHHQPRQGIQDGLRRDCLHHLDGQATIKV
jgi:hypothetical protein